MASNFLQRLFAPLYHEKRVDLTSPPRDVIPTEAGAILGIAMEIGAEMLKSGALGDSASSKTLLRYWQMQERAGYPNASENVKYFEDMARKESEFL